MGDGRALRELSLFSGAGGGLLASHLLGWRTVGYVEFNDYCQRVIAQRIQDGHLCNAPIFGDIQAFIDEGWASVYQGMVDVVSGGFPCQPFSVAGKQAAADDPRNMWPATLEVIRLVRPRFAFLENVPGLLARSHGYFGSILSDLAEVGYDARWTVLSAADCGAPHIRKRLWIVAADTNRSQQGRGLEQVWRAERGNANASRDGAEGVAAPDSERSELRDQPRRGSGTGGEGAAEPRDDGQTREVATDPDTNGGRQQVSSELHREEKQVAAYWPPRGKHPDGLRDEVADAALCGRDDFSPPERGTGEGQGAPGGPDRVEGRPWWQTEPAVGRVADGVASRVDRLKALGNGQVPAVAATAWRLLTNA